MTDLDELSRLLDQATPGPWKHVTNAPEGNYGAVWHEHYVYAPEARYASLPGNPSPVKVAYMPQAPDKRPAHDAALIAALRNHAEELVRDARRYRFMLRHIHSLIAVVDEWENTVTLEWGRDYEHKLIAPTIPEAIDAAIAQERTP